MEKWQFLVIWIILCASVCTYKCSQFWLDCSNNIVSGGRGHPRKFRKWFSYHFIEFENWQNASYFFLVAKNQCYFWGWYLPHPIGYWTCILFGGYQNIVWSLFWNMNINFHFNLTKTVWYLSNTSLTYIQVNLFAHFLWKILVTFNMNTHPYHLLGFKFWVMLFFGCKMLGHVIVWVEKFQSQMTIPILNIHSCKHHVSQLTWKQRKPCMNRMIKK